MADGIDAAMDPVQLPPRCPVCGAAGAQAQSTQLRHRDDSVLSSSQLRERWVDIRTYVVRFSIHCAIVVARASRL
ncbi:MAG: hypothetical protein ACXVFN_13480 [Solirubrobacteraceae bacterium]